MVLFPEIHYLASRMVVLRLLKLQEVGHNGKWLCSCWLYPHKWITAFSWERLGWSKSALFLTEAGSYTKN